MNYFNLMDYIIKFIFWRSKNKDKMFYFYPATKCHVYYRQNSNNLKRVKITS